MSECSSKLDKISAVVDSVSWSLTCRSLMTSHMTKLGHHMDFSLFTYYCWVILWSLTNKYIVWNAGETSSPAEITTKIPPTTASKCTDHISGLASITSPKVLEGTLNAPFGTSPCSQGPPAQVGWHVGFIPLTPHIVWHGSTARSVYPTILTLSQCGNHRSSQERVLYDNSHLVVLKGCWLSTV